MILIRNKEDLRNAYISLYIFEKYNKVCPSYEIVTAMESRKYLIRTYHRNMNSGNKEVLVKDYGADGYISLIALPSTIKSEEDAERYFGEYIYIESCPSFYDCTGRAFTAWHKIIKRRGQFFVYHRVAYDV